MILLWLISIPLGLLIGYDKGRYFLGLTLPLFFGPLGFIAVCCLRDKAQEKIRLARYIQRRHNGILSMKIKYETIALRTVAMDIIAKANTIIEKYQTDGYDLTLRQLYYQFVAHDLFPDKWISKVTGSKNCQENYDKLGNIISSGRRAGLIDWNAIVDRTRFLRSPSFWNTPNEIIDSMSRVFKYDIWADQDYHVELWFEKDALLGTMERAAELQRLPIFSNRGYVSDSSVWEAAQRIASFQRRGKECVVLHFGDHDPSGKDMTRDVTERLRLFGATPEIRRMALNMPQVRKYNPPPNPAKETDSRFAEYAAEFGELSWELDALPPEVMVSIVQKAITGVINPRKWARCIEREQVSRAEIKLVANVAWQELIATVKKHHA